MCGTGVLKTERGRLRARDGGGAARGRGGAGLGGGEALSWRWKCACVRRCWRGKNVEMGIDGEVAAGQRARRVATRGKQEGIERVEDRALRAG